MQPVVVREVFGGQYLGNLMPTALLVHSHLRIAVGNKFRSEKTSVQVWHLACNKFLTDYYAVKNELCSSHCKNKLGIARYSARMLYWGMAWDMPKFQLITNSTDKHNFKNFSIKKWGLFFLCIQGLHSLPFSHSKSPRIAFNYIESDSIEILNFWGLMPTAGTIHSAGAWTISIVIHSSFLCCKKTWQTSLVRSPLLKTKKLALLFFFSNAGTFRDSTKRKRVAVWAGRFVIS